MTLKEYYKGLKEARLVFKKQVLDATEVSEVTFYKWVNNKIRPNKLTRDFIAKLAGTPEEKLFPIKENTTV